MGESKQHVQVPNMNLSNLSDGLTHIDPFVYASIKRYMNNKTKIAFPSINTLIKDTGLTTKTLLKSIERLMQSNYILIVKTKGRSNHYVFNSYKQFEIFDYDFLDNPDLTNKEKAYLVAALQYMFKNPEEGTGSIRYDNTSFAKKLGITPKTLKKVEATLTTKGAMELIPTTLKELMMVDGQYIPTTGFNIPERVYSFTKMCNLIALKFQQQDQRLDSVEDRLSKVESVLEENKQLKAENAQLKEQLAKQETSKIVL